MAKVTVEQKLGLNIRKFIKKAKLGMNHAADFAGVSRSQLYDIIKPKNPKSPTTDFLDRLGEALKVESYEFLK